MTAPWDNRPHPGEAEALLRQLDSFQRRGQWLSLLGGTAWVLAGCSTMFVALVAALGWWGGTACRAIGWSAVLGGLVALVVFALYRPLRAAAASHAAALRIGEVHPRIASDVLSASQLARAPEDTPFSPLLLARHLSAMRDRISALPRREVYSAGVLVWPFIGLLAASVLAGVSYTASPGVFAAGLGALTSDPSPPQTRARHIATRAPVVADLTLTLRYPAYLDRPERRLDATSGGLVAPLGTTVLLQGRALVTDAQSGAIDLPDGSRSPLTLDAEGTVRGHFVVLSAGLFALSLTTPTMTVQGPSCSLEVEPDAPPTVRLIRPTGDVEVDANGELVLDIEAGDDHGLSRIDLVVSAGQHQTHRRTVIHLADRVKNFKNSYHWSPQSVRIGDSSDVRIEVEAYDDDTILGPKPGRSEVINARIMTPLSRHRSALEKQGEALDTLVDLLANRLESPPLSDRHGDQVKARFTEVRRETEDALGDAARLIHLLGQDSMTPRRVVDAFAQIREDMANQLLYETRLHRPPVARFRDRQGVDRVTVRLLEDAVIRVDDLIIDQRLGRLVGAGATLEQQRRELAELLSGFAGTRSESARRAVIEALEAMEGIIRRLQQETEVIRGKVSDSYFNPSGVLHLDLLGSLTQLRAHLAEGDLDAALDLVSRLEGDLGRLMAGLEGGLLSFRTERFGESERFVGELLDRLMSVEAGQIQVRRETVALQRRYQERLVEVMRGRIDPLVRRQLKAVGEMRRALDELESPEGETARRRLVQLRVAAREIEMALSQGDLDEARQIAEHVSDIADDWATEAGAEVPRRVTEVARIANRLGEEVTEAYPKPAQLLSERDRRYSRILASKQRLLTARSRKIRAWIAEQGEETRFLSRRAHNSLTKVVGLMSEAVKHLEGRRVRTSLSDQSSALDELARLREDLKRGDEVARLESRPVVIRGKVELPDPDEYEVPPRFREDILEAMRSDLPSRYQEAIRKYYETLVR